MSDSIGPAIQGLKPMAEADVFASLNGQMLRQAADMEARAAQLYSNATAVRSAASKVASLAGVTTVDAGVTVTGTGPLQSMVEASQAQAQAPAT